MKKNNPVAKYQHRFNQARTFRDKKKDLKRGYQKHRNLNRDQSPHLSKLVLVQMRAFFICVLCLNAYINNKSFL